MATQITAPDAKGVSGAVPRRKPGPVPGPEKRQYTILIEPELGDWGKQQPGGLSEMVRQLLREAKERQGEASR